MLGRVKTWPVRGWLDWVMVQSRSTEVRRGYQVSKDGSAHTSQGNHQSQPHAFAGEHCLVLCTGGLITVEGGFFLRFHRAISFCPQCSFRSYRAAPGVLGSFVFALFLFPSPPLQHVAERRRSCYLLAGWGIYPAGSYFEQYGLNWSTFFGGAVWCFLSFYLVIWCIFGDGIF